jgi:xylan 1,4-beta-xylosidase
MTRLFSLLTALIFTMGIHSQSLETYRNPVIAGFHPDPSVCRVGDDFYLVNSSFEYFPGVPVYHSRDLVHWEQIGNMLDRPSQLNLKDASSWTGIYAPTIRYNDGTYYMITTNIGNGGNFMVTAKDPKGPWSEPIWLKQQGIDPSLYFENGHCYMVSNPGNMITLCEIDPKTGHQLSESKGIWQGEGGRYPEGPHIYKKDGYYYLLISEGGTELAHHLTIARSRQMAGPYEACPANPILTNCNRKGQSMQIQGTGHGDFVEAQDGSWWVIFLAYRNFGGSYHHLGRETYLAPVEWKAGEWPVVNQGEAIDTLMTARLLPQTAMQKTVIHTAFNGSLGPEWIHIQNPITANYKIGNGKLRLYPHGSLTENHQPTFIGRRQEAAKIVAETAIDMEELDKNVEKVKSDTSAVIKAGLTVYQINDGHFDFYTDGYFVGAEARLKSLSADFGTQMIKEGCKKLRLRITSDGLFYHFLYAFDDGGFTELTAQNCSLMSTEVAGGFTGVTLGLFAAGPSDGSYADFQYFDYTEK